MSTSGNSQTSMKTKLKQWIQRRRLTAAFVMLGIVTSGIVIGSVLARGVQGQTMQSGAVDAVPLHIPPAGDGPESAFAKIAKEVGPAVVNINTESLPKTASRPMGRGHQLGPNGPNGGDQGNGEDNFQDFFNHFFGGHAPNGGGDDGGDDDGNGGAREALGSGFIVDPHGYIITNNHVVDKADKIYVQLSTDPDAGSDLGRPAHVVGVDKDTDIAVIKIDTDVPLPTIQMGNSDSADVGDWVLAIGSPFNERETVTAGIISAKNRTIDEGASGQFQRFIQTDAAINPGNSGGPLVDMNGRVIGMNTEIYTTTGSYAGIGFAMPANTIVNVYNDLIGPDHKVVRGSIGVQFQGELPSAVKREYGVNQGVIVSSVAPNGPAEAAGIKAEDIIVSIDGRNIKGGDDMVADIASRLPGTTIKLGYIRDGKPGSATVAIADRSKLYAGLSEADNSTDSGGTPEVERQDKLGITPKALSADDLSKLDLKGGVVIDAVKPGSFADQIGLQPGLIILEINKKPVTDLGSYHAAVSGLKSGDDVVLVVRSARDNSGANTYVGGTLP
jgi:serine protease Do